MKVVPISLNVVQKVSQVRLYMSNDLRPRENRMSVLKSLQEVQRRFPNCLPLLDPVKDMKIKDRAFDELVKNIKKFEQRMEAHPLHKDSQLKSLFEQYEKKFEVFIKIVLNFECAIKNYKYSNKLIWVSIILL